MWRAALGDSLVDQITQASLKENGGTLFELCTDLEEDWTLSQDDKSIILRVCTFMALPIRHICCCFWEHTDDSSSDSGSFIWTSDGCEEDEVKEIQEEDANELAVLEDLLTEFESKIDEMDCTLAMFFETYWLGRMGQVLQEIQDRTLLEEEVQGAERLGITLRVEEENMQEDDSQLEDWFRGHGGSSVYCNRDAPA
ncbi:hypothetical protein CGLO_17415 [Colletotrichum gloeosporioides Cg-14]|uniref:Uncharacterized protein n=1 Tax=Colletotrichum gloeosporioides (strain Cg-14) TaxID=1237896 RepID=T0L6J1_COLGC|nr:hypothetical protein CGLO_17415 [Colletotrichum gloeosporioides Cg-14]